MEERYIRMVEQRVKDTWHNWTNDEKKARASKAAYDAAMRELQACDMGIEERLNQLESRGGTI